MKKNDQTSVEAKKLIDLKPKAMLIFKFIIVPIILILVAMRIFVVKTYQRELFYSSEGYVQRQEIEVGSQGYGNVSSISVSVGDYVNSGDTLYRYNNSDLDDTIYNLQKKGTDLLNGTLVPNTPEANVTVNDFNKNIEFTVYSKASGVIKKINSSVGDYVTKDQVVMEMESSEAFVSTFLKVPADLINQIAPGVQSYIKLNNGLVLDGYVKDVSPSYDADQNLVSADVLISQDELAKIDIKNIPTGTPVNVVVQSEDAFTEAFKGFVGRIKIPFIKSFLSYEI